MGVPDCFVPGGAAFRRADWADLQAIADIYDATHDREEAGETTTGWIRGIYPTEQTARTALQRGEMFVETDDAGHIVACARLNQEQDPAYARASWRFDAPAERVMVMHTLVVSPDARGRGCGAAFAAFYEQYALAHDCPFLRIDTNERNTAARTMYKRLGYEERSVIPCTFNGLEHIRLVCLEKELASGMEKMESDYDVASKRA